MSSVLTPRDWSVVRRAYRESAPFEHVVVDDFLQEDKLHAIRESLLADGGWRRKNWQVSQLFNRQPPIACLDQLVEEIKDAIGELAPRLDLVKHWAVACNENEGLHVHADNACIAVNVWLTPDEHNRDESSGGMILYDLKRSPTMAVHEFNAMPWAGTTFSASGPRKSNVIGYRSNRAVIFDAAIFHSSDSISFELGSMATLRMGLTMAFDDPVNYSARMKTYGTDGNQ